MSGFYAWLKTQTEREDFVGDLAKDAVADKEFPKKDDSYEGLHSYLSRKATTAGVLVAFGEAWLEYIRGFEGAFTDMLPIHTCTHCGSEDTKISDIVIVDQYIEFSIFCDSCEEVVEHSIAEKKIRILVHLIDKNKI